MYIAVVVVVSVVLSGGGRQRRRRRRTRGMLADAKDKSIVDDQTVTLRLYDVEIVALSVRGRVPDVEIKGGVLARV